MSRLDQQPSPQPLALAGAPAPAPACPVRTQLFHNVPPTFLSPIQKKRKNEATCQCDTQPHSAPSSHLSVARPAPPQTNRVRNTENISNVKTKNQTHLPKPHPPAHDSVDFPTNGGRGGSSSIEAGLELFGALVAYRRVTSLAIVPAFDVLEDRLSGFFARCIFPVMHQFLLQRPPEAFHHRVVVAVAGAAHARGDVMRLQQTLVILLAYCTPRSL